MFQIIAQQRPSLRWKEWIPLFSQQLRLRNLVQIIAFNIKVNGKNESNNEEEEISDHQVNKNHVDSLKTQPVDHYYYTLHWTMMSAPFYTSEKLSTINPKWNEIDPIIFGTVNSATNVFIVRLWLHHGSGQPDRTITVWAVYLTGLMYVGPKISTDPRTFTSNTLVFHLVGGYFTAYEHLKEPQPKIRKQNVILASNLVSPSYNEHCLLRLQTSQSAIRKQMIAVQSLREKISFGCFNTNYLKKMNEQQQANIFHLQQPQSQNQQHMTPEMIQELHRDQLNHLRKEIELVKFRVQLLTYEKTRKEKELKHLDNLRNLIIEKNLKKKTELIRKNEILQKDIQEILKLKKAYLDLREMHQHFQIQLNYRRKQLIYELNHFYPIEQLENEQYTICKVVLPNSEDFLGHDEVAIAVALGYVAHVLQMISFFLHVPLRYPIIYFGSRSKIIDHIADKILDNEREFPLFSRGNEKLQFNYGVYLLNKNIAQLRWYCNQATIDLRATLPNLRTLIQLQPSSSLQSSELIHRATSGSSLDQQPSSRPPQPGKKTSMQRSHQNFTRGHRISKSMGSSELKFEGKMSDPEITTQRINKTPNTDADVNQEFFRRRNRSRRQHAHPLVVSMESPPNEMTPLVTRSLDNGMDRFDQGEAIIDFDIPTISGGGDANGEAPDSSEEALRVSIGEEASPEALFEAWQTHFQGDDSGACDTVLEITSPNEHQALIEDCQRVESLFATVATRTAALSTGSGSFNLVRSRNNSSAEDAFST